MPDDTPDASRSDEASPRKFPTAFTILAAPSPSARRSSSTTASIPSWPPGTEMTGTIRLLVDDGFIVVCVGGGGVGASGAMARR